MDHEYPLAPPWVDDIAIENPIIQGGRRNVIAPTSMHLWWISGKAAPVQISLNV